MKPHDPLVKEAAYKKLAEIIERHSRIIARSEKQRLIKERILVKDNTAEYNKKLKAAKRVLSDTSDNLIKMALVIIKDAEKDELLKCIEVDDTGAAADIEEGDIETRVTRADAEKLLKAWKKLLIKYENEHGSTSQLFEGSSTSNQDSLLPSSKGDSVELDKLKD